MMEQTAHRLSSFWTQFYDNYLWGSRWSWQWTKQKTDEVIANFFRPCWWSWSIETFYPDKIQLYIATWNHMNLGTVTPVLSGHLRGTAGWLLNTGWPYGCLKTVHVQVAGSWLVALYPNLCSSSMRKNMLLAIWFSCSTANPIFFDSILPQLSPIMG